MNKRIIILCTGNSCRSQMAEAIIQDMRPEWQVFSAGTNPASQVHPIAIQVMKEIGIDLSNAKPQNVDQFINQAFDYVITVCDNAKETCPIFMGEVKEQLHIGFQDPAEATGTDEEVLAVFRKVREQIKKGFQEFVNEIHERSQ